MRLYNKLLAYVKALAFSALLLTGFSACRDDVFGDLDDVPRQDNLPVDLLIDIKGPETRGPSYFKKEFEAGDVIHVQGTFRNSDNSKTIKYAAFRYDGEKWNQYSGAEGTAEVKRFTWPNNCVDAEFVAYFIHGSNSLMVPVDNPESVTPTTLSEIAGTSTSNPDKDPLKATSSGIRYGHTIPLEFFHACSYLTVEELPAGVSSVFWFTRELGGNVAPDFKNGFRAYLTTDNELHFDFVQVPDPDYSDKVYIQGTTKTGFVDGFEKANASFFLAPGQYLNFIVGYPGSNEMVNYISYSKAFNAQNPDLGGDGEGGGDIEGGTPGTVPNVNNELTENGVYTFNVSKSSGVKIESKPSTDDWDETDNPIYNVDAEAFLWAICNNQEYEVDNVLIIKPEGTTSTLLHNVNINWAKYDIFPPSDVNGQTWFDPTIGQGVTFDGAGHYIWNLGSPLFNTVNGTVRRLGLANAEINVVTRDNYTPSVTDPENPEDPENPGSGSVLASGTYDMSRQGALCGYVDRGTIENIRVKTAIPSWYPERDPSYVYKDVFTLNAKVYGVSSQESHNIGCLIGSNGKGLVNDITIFCDMNLNVENYDSESHIPRVYVGGVIGQNVSQVHYISSGTGENRINIYNRCSYELASYSIGGVVGYFSGGTMNNITIPYVYIDSRQSMGFTSYIGGAAGFLSNGDEGGTFLNVSVAGMVFSGKGVGGEEGNGTVCTGGLVGEAYESYQISGCYTGADVFGSSVANQPGDDSVLIATGGMFGKISKFPGQTTDLIRDNISTCMYVRGPSPYLGTFAGIVPRGETWDKDYENHDLIISTPQNGATMPKIGGNSD